MSIVDVSIITPTFRREHLVVEAIRSAINQAGVTLEVIVIDDSAEGSARTAIESLADPRVHYVPCRQPSGGKPARVRNQGVTLARGRYIHCLDDDDRLADGALAALVGALDRRPDVGVAVGWVVPFGDDAAWLEDKRAYFERAARTGAELRSSLAMVAHILFRGTLMVNSACMIRREHFVALGGYDDSMPVYEDVDFYMRAIRRYGHVYVARPILHYRTGAPSLMTDLQGDNSLVRDSYAIMYRKYEAEHGSLEFYGLKLFAKALPFRTLAKLLPC